MSSRRINLDGVTLGDGVSPQHFVLPAGTVLDSAERVVITYGSDTPLGSMRVSAASKVPFSILGWPTDTTLQWIWQTDFVLADSGALTVSVWDSTESQEIERVVYDADAAPMAPGCARTAFASRDAEVAAADFVGATWTVDGAPVERKSIKFGLGESYAFSKLRGTKRYELSDHLGNVAVVLSDRKLAQDPDADLAVDFFEGEVLSARDFYPGACPERRRSRRRFVMPERSFSTDAYRYGFNDSVRVRGAAKKPLSEWKGEGNSYDYGFRVHDARLGRFLSVDPLTSVFPSQSPYTYSMNNPVMLLDREGDHPVIAILIGAALGVGISVTSQIGASLAGGATMKEAIGDIDWFDVAISGVVGAATFGVGAETIGHWEGIHNIDWYYGQQNWCW